MEVLTLRGLLTFIIFMALLIFFLPYILGLVLLIIGALAVFLLLARMGFLPGARYRSYTYTGKGDQSARKTVVFTEESAPSDDNAGGWYQSVQEGETITLPETALKKEDEQE